MSARQDGKTAKTLMIVEDEALVAILLRDELQDAGYKVLDLTDRHVEALEGQTRIELHIGESCLARGNRRRHAIAQRIEQGTFFAPFLGAHAAQRLQEFADGTLFAERAHAHRFQRRFGQVWVRASSRRWLGS